jgi:hypothetical protein
LSSRADATGTTLLLLNAAGGIVESVGSANASSPAAAARSDAASPRDSTSNGGTYSASSSARVTCPRVGSVSHGAVAIVPMLNPADVTVVAIFCE